MHTRTCGIHTGRQSIKVGLSVQGIPLCADRGNVPQVPVCQTFMINGIIVTLIYLLYIIYIIES